MPDVLIRNIDERTVNSLKERARQHRTSLQQEVKTILEEAGRSSLANAESVANRIRANLQRKGIQYTDSGRLQSEDRVR